MGLFPEVVERAIDALKTLPGIGQKSAERIAFDLLGRSLDDVKKVAASIYAMREKMQFCGICNNLSEKPHCPICSDERRDRSVICVVERPSDIPQIEKGGKYKGLYYVLLSSISPTKDQSAGEQIDLKKLRDMIDRFDVAEVIVATDSDTEGEFTALYVKDAIADKGVRITRIAVGIPVGANLEYMDPMTLSKAIQHRAPI